MKNIMATISVIILSALVANVSFAGPRSFNGLLGNSGYWAGKAKYYVGCNVVELQYATQVADSGRALKTLPNPQKPSQFQNFFIEENGLKFELNFGRHPIKGTLNSFSEDDRSWTFRGDYMNHAVKFTFTKISNDEIEIAVFFDDARHAYMRLTKAENLFQVGALLR
jgi:hypothetical protein